MKTKILITTLLVSALPYLFFAQGSWTQKANYPAALTNGGVGFSIGTKGYIMCGGPNTDVWEWEQSTNSWTQKTNFPGTDTYRAAGFSIGTKGYYGTGNLGLSYSVATGNFYEFDPVANTWTAKAFIPVVRFAATGFSIAGKGYMVGGSGLHDCYEYNPITDTWTAKAPYPGLGQEALSSFTIGTNGYVGCGFGNGAYQNDFWEFDPLANTWTAKTSFSGAPRKEAVGFTIAGNGYIGTGADATTNYTDFWEYDAATDTWSSITAFAAVARKRAVAFAIGNKGYAGTGIPMDNVFFEYCDTCAANGVSEIDLDNLIDIYPNPSTGVFIIKTEHHKFNHIDVSNVIGQMVYTTSTSIYKTQNEIDLSALPVGIYFMKIKTEKGILNKKVILAK